MMNRCVVSIALMTMAGVAPAEQVANGDFSSGFIGWIWRTDANASAMVPTVSAGPFGTGPAFHVNPGSNTYPIERGGTLSQPLWLTGGVHYSVSAVLAIQSTGGDNLEGGIMTVSLGGTLLDTFNVDSINANALLTHSVARDFTPVADGMYDLDIRCTRRYTNENQVIYHWADSLSVVPVPAPASLFLLTPAGLGVVCRRR